MQIRRRKNTKKLRKKKGGQDNTWGNVIKRKKAQDGIEG